MEVEVWCDSLRRHKQKKGGGHHHIHHICICQCSIKCIALWRIFCLFFLNIKFFELKVWIICTTNVYLSFRVFWWRLMLSTMFNWALPISEFSKIICILWSTETVVLYATFNIGIRSKYGSWVMAQDCLLAPEKCLELLKSECPGKSFWNRLQRKTGAKLKDQWLKFWAYQNQFSYKY